MVMVPISLGKASANQRLVEGSGEFWDFRLESQSVDPDVKPQPDPRPTPPPGPAPEPRPKPGVKAVVPQVPTYLLLPNALRHLGLMNVSNQNQRLEALRIASGGLLENREKPLFLCAAMAAIIVILQIFLRLNMVMAVSLIIML